MQEVPPSLFEEFCGIADDFDLLEAIRSYFGRSTTPPVNNNNNTTRYTQKQYTQKQLFEAIRRHRCTLPGGSITNNITTPKKNTTASDTIIDDSTATRIGKNESKTRDTSCANKIIATSSSPDDFFCKDESFHEVRTLSLNQPLYILSHCEQRRRLVEGGSCASLLGRSAMPNEIQNMKEANHVFSSSLISAFHQLEKAEVLLERGHPLCSHTEEAITLLELAAKNFSICKLFGVAANCYVRCSDCAVIAREVTTAGHYLVYASDACKKVGTECGVGCDDAAYLQSSKMAALASMQEALEMYEAQGRSTTVTKYIRQAAELAVSCGNPGLGVDLLNAAADQYIAVQRSSDARACLFRAVQIAVLDFSDFSEAIDSLERLSRMVSIREMPHVLFRAILCRIVCIPAHSGVDFIEAMKDAATTFDEYMTLCTPLCQGREYGLVRSLLKCIEQHDADCAEGDVARYIVQSTLEEWMLLVLRRIHKNIIVRAAAIEKLYSLDE